VLAEGNGGCGFVGGGKGECGFVGGELFIGACDCGRSGETVKVLAISGYSGSGKTTNAEAIIGELKIRGYRVTAAKNICSDGWSSDTPGTNTHRLARAGAEYVIARGPVDCAVIHPERVDTDRVIGLMDGDWAILEGFRDARLPRLVCIREERELKELLTDLTVAVSGVGAEDLGKESNGLPVVNSLDDIKELVDLLEERVPHRPGMMDCGQCGFDNCQQWMTAHIKGEPETRCDYGGNIRVRVNGQILDLKGFIGQQIEGVVRGVLGPLRGYEDGDEVVIKFGKTASKGPNCTNKE